MYEKFCDYMYYLLTAPFKRIKKTANQWYILFKVLGNRMDDAMESLYRAQEQTMLATCDPVMLQVHADERKLKKYTGEDDENFRRRIANHAEVMRLGGSNEGVILAVKMLGYDNPQIVMANVYTGRCVIDEDGSMKVVDETKEDRWAEFYVLVNMNVDDRHPISTQILKKEVRKQKYIGAKDNYCFTYSCSVEHEFRSDIKAEHRMMLMFWNYFTMDGSWVMDGSKTLDAYSEDVEEIDMESVTSKIRRKKMAEASRYGNVLAKAKWIALGSGGVDEDGKIITPLEENVALRNEIIRKEYSGVSQESDTAFEYTIHLGENELVGEYISEIALIDEDGDFMVSAVFLPQGKDETETTYKIVDGY